MRRRQIPLTPRETEEPARCQLAYNGATLLPNLLRIGFHRPRKVENQFAQRPTAIASRQEIGNGRLQYNFGGQSMI
jgi:hypothetical protein